MPSPPPDALAPKDQWRRWARARRQALDTPALSTQVVARLLAWPAFRRAGHVLSYHAFGSEIDLAGLERPGCTFYLTRTGATPGHGLTVHRADEPLEPHPHGYHQPHAASEVIPPERIDLVLVPGLAFDRRGARLGYGRGYYDRLLPLLRPGVPRVGVTAEALIVPELPRDAYDAPMSHLASEAGVWRVQGGG